MKNAPKGSQGQPRRLHCALPPPTGGRFPKDGVKSKSSDMAYKCPLALINVEAHRPRDARSRRFCRRGRHKFVVEAYCDASFASEANARSITGYVLMVQGAAVAWASKTQSTVAMSTCEAEYIALAELTRDIKFVRNILEVLTFPQSTTLVYEDKAACIALAQQREVSKRSKHINLSYHATRLLVDQNIVKLIHCRSNEQLADSFTKIAIPAPRFQEHRDIYCGGAATSHASV